MAAGSGYPFIYCVRLTLWRYAMCHLTGSRDRRSRTSCFEKLPGLTSNIYSSPYEIQKFDFTSGISNNYPTVQTRSGVPHSVFHEMEAPAHN